jgi:hypothetical protein
MPHLIMKACDVRSHGALQERGSGGQLLLLGGIDGMGLIRPLLREDGAEKLRDYYLGRLAAFRIAFA